MDKSPDAFRTISEVAQDIDLPQHVLRFWETRFPQIKPLKRGGGRRYYRPDDIDLLRAIRLLLYDHGYTTRGVQRLLKQQGAKGVAAIGRGEPPPSMPSEADAADEHDTVSEALAVSEVAGDDARADEAEQKCAALLVLLEDALAELTDCARALASARAL